MGCPSTTPWNFSHDNSPLAATVLCLAQCCLSAVSRFKGRLLGSGEFFKEQGSGMGRDFLAI